MAFHDRRPNIDADAGDETPDEQAEEEGTPADPEEKNDPGEESEEAPEEEAAADDDAAGSEEAEEEDTVEGAPVVETPKKPSAKAMLEPIESIEATKARLLKEVEDLRIERRGYKEAPFQEQSKDPLFVKKDDEDLLKDVNAQDVDLIEKVLRAKGYVPKEEINKELSAKEYHTSVKSFTESWLESNPEFKPENDPEDEKWNQINAYATKYFSKPKDPKDVVEILDAARLRLFGKKSSTLPTKSLNLVAAKKEKIAASAKPSSGGSAGSKAAPTSTKKGINPDLMPYLQGFDDDELAEISAS